MVVFSPLPSLNLVIGTSIVELDLMPGHTVWLHLLSNVTVVDETPPEISTLSNFICKVEISPLNHIHLPV